MKRKLTQQQKHLFPIKKLTDPDSNNSFGLLLERLTTDYTNQTQRRKSISNPMTTPLKYPLEQAINKAVNCLNTSINQSTIHGTATQRSRIEKSIERTPNRKQLSYSRSSTIKGNKEYMSKLHIQTATFLKKYFSNNRTVAINDWIQAVIREYSDLWIGKGEAIIDQFAHKIKHLLKNESGNLDFIKLGHYTQDNGILGLILLILKQLNQQQQSYQYNSQELSSPHDLQNLKNIIQQFLQGMYKQLEDQIYSKFNVQMRRMVLKYKQAQKLMKTINQKITHNYDIFHYQQKANSKCKSMHLQINRLTQKLKNYQVQLDKQRLTIDNARKDIFNLTTENRKLQETIEKFQAHFLKINQAKDDQYYPGKTSSVPQFQFNTQYRGHFPSQSILDVSGIEKSYKTTDNANKQRYIPSNQDMQINRTLSTFGCENSAYKANTNDPHLNYSPLGKLRNQNNQEFRSNDLSQTNLQYKISYESKNGASPFKSNIMKYM